MRAGKLVLPNYPSRKLQTTVQCVVIVVGTCTAGALIHVQTLEHFVKPIFLDVHVGYGKFVIGWPFISTTVDRTHQATRSINADWFLLNLLVCLSLFGITMAGLVSFGWPRRPAWRFTLSDMFLGVTAMCIIAFLFVWDGNSRSVPLGYDRSFVGADFGDYSALAALPVYDQLAIWFCIFCTVVAGLAVVRKMIHWYQSSRSVSQ